MSKFIIVVWENTLQDGKLNIPEKFVSKNERILKKELIVLKVGKGEKWEVKWEKQDDGKVWLHGKGWKEFEDHYSIKHGHLLLFIYQGNSNFKVVICNKTATEIAYPSKSKSNNPTANDPDDETDSDSSSVQILDGFPKKKKRKKTTTPIEEPPNLSIQTSKATDQAAKGRKQKYSTKRSENALDMDKDIAVQRAKAFESKYPFFWILLRPSYFHQRYLNIPKKFVKEHLEDESTDVILENSKRRTWLVRFVYRIDKKKPNGKFSGGWKKFVKDNNVEIGNVCVFELINKGQQLSFRVRIFRSP